jgi:hypothetical protein
LSASTERRNFGRNFTLSLLTTKVTTDGKTHRKFTAACSRVWSGAAALY